MPIKRREEGRKGRLCRAGRWTIQRPRRALRKAGYERRTPSATRLGSPRRTVPVAIVVAVAGSVHERVRHAPVSGHPSALRATCRRPPDSSSSRSPGPRNRRDPQVPIAQRRCARTGQIFGEVRKDETGEGVSRRAGSPATATQLLLALDALTLLQSIDGELQLQVPTTRRLRLRREVGFEFPLTMPQLPDQRRETIARRRIVGEDPSYQCCECHTGSTGIAKPVGNVPIAFVPRDDRSMKFW